MGMKIYDSHWYVRFGLEPEQAADILKAMGVTFVLASSKLLPMQDTAIESEVSAAERSRFATLNDRTFRDALAVRGIAYFSSILFGFDPKLLAAHPEMLPIDQHGRPEEKVDWYIGIPADREINVQHKLSLLRPAVEALQPDGVHLGFIRWPGFWEIWLDDVKRNDMPDFCYGQQTLTRFCADSGLDLPVGDPVKSASIIKAQHRETWKNWKCLEVVKTVAHVKSELRKSKSDLQIAINSLPFFLDDFDNAVEEVFGQSPTKLGEVAEVLEVMAYHQIMRRDVNWPGQIGSDVKRRSGRTTICTIQGNPLYLEGMHANRGRSTELPTEEFIQLVDSVQESEADGVCVFTFTDFLGYRDTADGRRRIDRLKNFRA
ncbi:MAG: hypothetical protein ACKVP5_15690 [Aestuariivirga sp.]